jgi:hypothetical protein
MVPPAPPQPEQPEPGKPREVSVGLLADPDLPTDLGRRLADELPGVLTDRVSREVTWRVELLTDPFEAATGYERVYDLAVQRVRGTAWDIALCITDLPVRTTDGVVLADVSRQDRVGLISLPALGGVRLRRRALDVAVTLVAALLPALTGTTPGAEGEQRPVALASRRTRHVANPDQDIDAELVLPGGRGTYRLLAGAVRANRPWRLALGMSTALAGAAAGSAFGVLYSALWTLAGVLEPWRLAAWTLTALAGLGVWLVAGHNLWEARDPARPLTALRNAATVLTVAIGVLVFALVLFAFNAVAATLVIPPGYLSEVLGRPVGWTDYARVAVMATDLGIMAGAVGSGLEDDDTVRRAAYGTREQQRRRQVAG